MRGTVSMVHSAPGLAPQGYMEVDNTEVDRPGRIELFGETGIGGDQSPEVPQCG